MAEQENLGADVLRIAKEEGVSQKSAARGALIGSRNRRRGKEEPWEEENE